MLSYLVGPSVQLGALRGVLGGSDGQAAGMGAWLGHQQFPGSQHVCLGGPLSVPLLHHRPALPAGPRRLYPHLLHRVTPPRACRRRGPFRLKLLQALWTTL